MSDSPPKDQPHEQPIDSGNETSFGPQLIVEEFRDAWHRGQRPQISEFLPRTSDSQSTEILFALIRADMLERSHAGETIRLEWYLDEFPVVSNDREQLIALIIDEYSMRRDAGDDVAYEQWHERFPDVVDELQRRLGLVDQSKTMSSSASSVTRLDHQLAAGTVVEEFEIVRLLGTGGAARVYLAKQQPLDRLVALKISMGFAEEGAKQAAIEHENIIAVYSERIVGQYRLLAMQYVPGITLAALLIALNDRDRRQIKWCDLTEIIERNDSDDSSRIITSAHLADNLPFVDSACRLILGLARALVFAHQSGILHRDIKPENILVAPDGRAMLADFNVAVRTDSLAENRVENLGGTLEYMSPEHLALLTGTDANGGATDFIADPTCVDAQSDVYSLGIVFFELLTGFRPFPIAESDGPLLSTARTVLAQRIQSIPDWDAASVPVSPLLTSIVNKCLIPHRGEQPKVPARYQSARHLVEDLECYLNRRPLRHAAIDDWYARTKNWIQLHHRISFATIAIAVVIGAFVGWDIWSADQQLARAEELAAQASNLDDETDRQESGQMVAKAEQIVLDQNSLFDYPGLRRRRARLFHDFGLVFAKQARFESAVSYFEQAIQLDPELGEAHNSLGYVHFHLEYFDSAVKSFDQAIRLGCDEVDVLPNRGAARAALGDVTGAQDDFERTLELRPDSAAAKRGLELLKKATQMK